MRALWIALALGLLVASPARAADAAAVTAVAQQLHAPSCPPNFSVADCPTDEARQMRARVAALLDEGLTPTQVVATFQRDYGPQVRYVPSARGAGLVAWLLPGFAVLGGAAVCLLVVRRARGADPATPPPDDDPVLAERLRDYL